MSNVIEGKSLGNVETVLKFKDKGISVEEARKQMLAAGEAPAGLLTETRKNNAVRGEGGSSSAPAPTPQAAPKKVYPTSAKLTVINEDGSDGETQTITAETPKQLDAQIQSTHARAAAAKKNVRVDLIVDNAAVEPPTTTTPGPTQQPGPTPSVSVSPTVTAEVAEKIENSKFTASIFKEDGEWIAEIVYKNGAGTERFSAPSKSALHLKILEGKGNATLRVREAIRREKYGVELDQEYDLPDYMTQEAFNALPAEAQQGMLDTIAANAGNAFKDLHPEYYPTPGNSERVQKFLNRQPNSTGGRGLPYTVQNLEFAFAELSEQDPEWEFRPVPKFVAPSVLASAPATEDSVPAPAASVAPVSTEAAPVAPAVVVRKRGTTGLQPGFSSAANTELETTEEGSTPREPSVAELRSMPLSELKKLQQKSLKPNRQF